MLLKKHGIGRKKTWYSLFWNLRPFVIIHKGSIIKLNTDNLVEPVSNQLKLLQQLNSDENIVKLKPTIHDTAVSKALWTIAVKHWKTAGIRFGVLRYSKTQVKALLAVSIVVPPFRIPPLLLKRMISRKATARR